MSDTNEAQPVEAAAAEAPKRRGRRPKAGVPENETIQRLAEVRRTRSPRVRHDADFAPVDGDYEPLSLTNEDPGFEYFWASDADRARLGHRGWVEEKWGPMSARPKFYFGEQKRGESIRYAGMTLLKLPKERAAAIRAADPARRRHAALMAEVLQPTKAGHRMQFTQQSLQS